ncbi:hypothetical protein FNJ47_44535 [Bradyrhizobium sp. UFLA 03-164]|uniref:Secreted protein n=1 Tax=Bradyrhizobium uaiense TaxID=2594946 RepID=A0A6P1BVL5_9BRAD|nr:hypothetical protein [Bradyrhizobium uaiense]
MGRTSRLRPWLFPGPTPLLILASSIVLGQLHAAAGAPREHPKGEWRDATARWAYRCRAHSAAYAICVRDVMWRGLSRLTDIALGAMVREEFVGN